MPHLTSRTVSWYAAAWSVGEWQKARGDPVIPLAILLSCSSFRQCSLPGSRLMTRFEDRCRTGSLFKDPWSSLNPRMRVREIVAEPLVVNRKVSPHEVKERVEEVMASVGLRPQQANLWRSSRLRCRPIPR
jgi:hypothetical protein